MAEGRRRSARRVPSPFDLLRLLVSKQKKRFKQDGYNLDLSYVGPDLIAMGFPSSSFEGIYRNPASEVVKFFEQRHPGHFKIYNLCAERWYDGDRMFHADVSHTYRFYDHEAPAFEILHPFCVDMATYLDSDPENVAVVHCKAGKGRTGVMIVCYLLYSGRCATPEEALAFYGRERTNDGKGVTIPSQRRYIGYFHRFVKNGCKFPFPEQELILRRIVFRSFREPAQVNFYIEQLGEGGEKNILYNHHEQGGELGDVDPSTRVCVMECDVPLQAGDVRLCFSVAPTRGKKKKKRRRGRRRGRGGGRKGGRRGGKGGRGGAASASASASPDAAAESPSSSGGGGGFKYVFKMCFHTKFIDDGYLLCRRREVDTAFKSRSKRYHDDFFVELFFANASTGKRRDLLSWVRGDFMDEDGDYLDPSVATASDDDVLPPAAHLRKRARRPLVVPAEELPDDDEEEGDGEGVSTAVAESVAEGGKGDGDDGDDGDGDEEEEGEFSDESGEDSAGEEEEGEWEEEEEEEEGSDEQEEG